LKRIEGQVRGILKMIEDDKSCEDILIQIGSEKRRCIKQGKSSWRDIFTIVS